MTKVVIIHGSNPRDLEKIEKGYPPQNKRHWIPWLKKQLEERGFEVFTPLMPKNWEPVYENWKKEFEKIPIDSDTILIGHSAGGSFVVRWLGETKTKVRKLILVAPWKVAEKWEKEEFYEIEKKFYNYEINPNIKKYFDKTITFTANDEDPDGKKSVKMFNEVLGGEIIELQNHGHYTLGDMGTEEFPELLEKVLE